MLIANLIFIVLIGSLCIAKVYQVKNQLKYSTIHTHIVIMAVSMFTALSFGTVLGIILMHDFVSAGIISTLFGLIAGYVVGKPFHSIAAIGGMTEGGMGGMMGAMTGMMIHMLPNHLFFLFFIDAIFILISFYLLWAIRVMSVSFQGETEGNLRPGPKSITMKKLSEKESMIDW